MKKFNAYETEDMVFAYFSSLWCVNLSLFNVMCIQIHRVKEERKL